jgi:hypothetical protein
MISPIDHLPNMVIGIILQVFFAILSSFLSRTHMHLILHLCNLFCPGFFLILWYFAAQRFIQRT